MSSTEPNWDGHKVIELFKRLSPVQCIEYLISGYMRENTTRKQYKIYPFDLQQLSIKYLEAQKFFIRFKIPPDIEHEIDLKNEHHAILKGGDKTFTVDLPIPVEDNSIKIMFNLKLNGRWLPNGYYTIALIPNTFKHFDSTIWGEIMCSRLKIPGVYGVFGNKFDIEYENVKIKTEFDANFVFNGQARFQLVEDNKLKDITNFVKKGDSNFKNDENLCIEYDGNLREFMISKVDNDNKQLICKMRVQQNDTKDFTHWYPAVCLMSSDDVAQII